MATINEDKFGRVPGVGYERSVRATLSAESAVAIEAVPAHADKLYVDAHVIASDGTVSRATDIDHSSGTDTVSFGSNKTGTMYYRMVSSVR